MSVAVIIPFFGDDPLRRRNLQHVLAFYRDSFPDWLIQQIGKGTLSASRNAGVDATAAEIVVLNDADTLCPPDQIEEAVWLAQKQPGPVSCFEMYLRLSEQATATLTGWQEAFTAPVEVALYEPPSNGCMAISRSSYVAVGGYDERFRQWGFEDMDFSARAHALYGKARTVSGEAVHLWHCERRDDDSPLDESPEAVARNWRLFEENQRERTAAR